jgi:hypothetical protein
VLSLLPWDRRGTVEPSAFTTTRGESWGNQFNIMVHKDDGNWLPAQFGKGNDENVDRS